MTLLKLITFDVTGTLVALKKSVGHQYAEIGSRYGINIPEATLTKQFHVFFQKLSFEHPNFGQTSGIGWQEWWKLLVCNTFHSSLPENVIIKPTTMDKICSDLIEIYKTRKCWKLAEGSQDLLDRLHHKNIPLGVISNYDPRLQDVLKDLNILKYFKFTIISYNERCQKPHPEIFRIVEDMYKGVMKEEILHIGNKIRLDYLGAKSVGWNAMLLADTRDVADNCDVDNKWVVESVYDIYPTLVNKKLI